MRLSRRPRVRVLCSIAAVVAIACATMQAGAAVAPPRPAKHATRIPVAAGQRINHLDGTLRPGKLKGTISGRFVYQATTRRGASGAHVTFFDQHGNAVKTTHDRHSGRFSLLLPPSKAGYAICVRDTRRRGFGGVAPVSSCVGGGLWVDSRSVRSAKLFRLHSGQHLNIGTELLKTGASITGHVHTTSGLNMTARITVRSVSHPNFIEARSAGRPQNKYNFADLPPSKQGYIVCVSGHAHQLNYRDESRTGYAGHCAHNVPWNNQPDDIPLRAKAVRVTAGRTLHLPVIVVHRGSAISGTITTADTGEAVQGYDVFAFDRTGHVVAHAESHSAGYKLASLLPGQRYRICTAPPRYAAVRLNYFGACHGRSAIWRRTSAPGGKKVLTEKGKRTKNVDLTVTKAAGISGTIKDDDGTEDIQSAILKAYRRSGKVAAADLSPENGGYHLTGLGPGRYTVCAYARTDFVGAPTCYHATAWAGPKWPLPADAQRVPVRSGKDTAGINLVLRGAGRFDGKALDAKTRKRIDSMASVYAPDGTLIQRSSTSGPGYLFTNLPPSKRGYRLCFSGTYASRFNIHTKYTYRGECYKNVRWSH